MGSRCYECGGMGCAICAPTHEQRIEQAKALLMAEGFRVEDSDRQKFRELREYCRTMSGTVDGPKPDWDRFGDLVQYILTGYWENLPWGVAEGRVTDDAD